MRTCFLEASCESETPRPGTLGGGGVAAAAPDPKTDSNARRRRPPQCPPLHLPSCDPGMRPPPSQNPRLTPPQAAFVRGRKRSMGRKKKSQDGATVPAAPAASSRRHARAAFHLRTNRSNARHEWQSRQAGPHHNVHNCPSSRDPRPSGREIVPKENNTPHAAARPGASLPALISLSSCIRATTAPDCIHSIEKNAPRRLRP